MPTTRTSVLTRAAGSFVGLFIAALGVLGILAPATLLELGVFAATQAGLYVAAALRIVFGLVLFFASRGALFPRSLQVLGVLFVLAGVATPVIGVERARAMLEWWAGRGTTFTLAWSVAPIVLGMFILYAVRPRRAARAE